MKQQITPWTIYENQNEKRLSAEKPRHAIIKFSTPTNTLSSPKSRQSEIRKTVDISFQKDKLTKKINSLVVIKAIRNQLQKDQYSKQLPVLSYIQDHEKSKIKLSKKLLFKQQKRAKNIPHFPRLPKQSFLEEDVNKNFDDKSIHENVQTLRHEKKKKNKPTLSSLL